MKIFFSGLILSLLLIPTLVLADDPPPCPDSAICNPLASDNLMDLVDRIIDFILFLAAPVAVLMTVYAGYLFITAADSQEKVKKAKQTLLWVVIGVIVLVLSKSVVVFVNSFLVP